MSVQSLTTNHLALRSAEDVFEVFRLLGYDPAAPEPFEGDDLDALELDEAQREVVQRAYIVARRDNHVVYLYEVSDLRQTQLRGLAWNAWQRRGSALLVVTTPDYREVLFIDPRLAGGKVNRSSVRVNKLKLVTADPKRHDADTLNLIHAHRRSGQQIYDAQAEAFNVTSITKKFYEEYRRHYEHARAVIKQYNKGVREFQHSDQTDKLHAFTQRLLGRLMFLYFLQRKGWLGGKQRFLTEQYRDTMRAHSGELTGDGETFHYYRDVLEPLFFETLNSKRPGDITKWQGVRIPYLNGGLFDASRDPEGPIILPDSLFDSNHSDGLLAFFNRYNFTIADDTPMEQDVAVDPEMLGKVFENMLEERDRGQSGSFYTPRTIVSYMCQEALAGYLEESARVPRDTTRAQFDPDAEVRYTPEEAARVNAALDTVTALDPAVGSGSFLIGMLNEIIRLRRACYAALNGTDEIPSSVLADWKEAIIRDTLYGVDIKPEAIEIAQLRLWLALVVDQTIEQARPLPNLDYKLMAGNSLIETIDGEPILGAAAQKMIGADVAPAQQTLGLFEADNERFKLDELRQQFFRVSPEERKRLREDITAQEHRIVSTSLREKAQNLQDQIDNLGKSAARQGGRLNRTDERKLNAATGKLAHITTLQEDLAKPDYVPPFFLYHLHFSEVFELKGGFDIVVANPPYVRGDTLGDLKQEFEVSEIYHTVYAGTADLYVYFFARGFDLLKRNGQLAFITSNKYLRASYGKGLRSFLSSQLRIQTIIDFGDLPLFDVAAYPCIILGNKGSTVEGNVKTLHVNSLDGMEDFNHFISTHAVQVQQSEFGETNWQILDRRTRDLLTKLTRAGTAFHKLIGNRFYAGVKTGFNKAFCIDRAKRDELIELDARSAEIIKPFITGRDIRTWFIEPNDTYIIFARRGIDLSKYPAIHAHLAQWQGELTPKINKDDSKGRKPGNYAWYEIQDNVAFYPAFEKPKIVYPDIAERPRFVLDVDNYYVDMTGFIIPDGDLFTLGVLNSSVADFFLKQISSTIRGGYIRFKSIYVGQIPIPDPSGLIRDQIAEIARQCLDTAVISPETLHALEAELNALVYQAYGLDADDIAIIEAHLAGKSNMDTPDIVDTDYD